MQPELDTTRLSPEPLPENIQSIQPGGGFGMRVELAWGRLRHRWLRTFRPGYVRKMQGLRRGSCPDCPHDVLDPRDLKFVRNRCGFSFDAADDPFAWRRRVPFARWGWAELWLFSVPLAAATAISAITWWYLAPAFGTVLCLVLFFFRDPPRRVPEEAGVLVSPADGTVSDVEEVDDEEFIDGPAVRIGIFLSIFSVHVNRVPAGGRIIRLRYQPGRFLNALRSESARENEQLAIGLQQQEPPHRRLLVRQIAGAIARRIVCDLRPGEDVCRGQRLGMIKFGSRTELVLPRESGLEIMVRQGERVKGGQSMMARYR